MEEISHTQSIHAVVKDGRLYDRSVLDDMLKAVEAANEQSRTVDNGQYVQH